MEFLTGLGYSIITLSIIIGVGVVLVLQFASTTSSCPTGYTYQNNGSTVYTTGLCCLSTGWSDCASAENYTNPHPATTQLNTLQEYLGTGTGGLATWIPLVIIAVIGMWFLGAFMTRRGQTKA